MEKVRSVGNWGKTGDDRLVIQRFDSKSNSWSYVEDVGINGASRRCRGMANKTGVKHRVWNTTSNKLFCECG